MKQTDKNMNKTRLMGLFMIAVLLGASLLMILPSTSACRPQQPLQAPLRNRITPIHLDIIVIDEITMRPIGPAPLRKARDPCDPQIPCNPSRCYAECVAYNEAWGNYCRCVQVPQLCPVGLRSQELDWAAEEFRLCWARTAN